MKKPLSGNFLVILFIAAIVTAAGCKKETSNGVILPYLTTAGMISEVTSTTAISGGSVYGSTSVTANGVCWSSANQSPTIADSKTTDSVITTFTSKLTGLTPGTVYYLRAYATGSGGETGYGDVMKFTTPSATSSRTVTVSTLAGSSAGAYGYQDGAGTSALFNGPQSIAYNTSAGTLYVGDTFNNLIRTVSTTGATGTLTAPTLGYQDGPLSTALFYGPKGMAFDAQGNTYVADMGNNRIRKITAAGIVSTLAGSGIPGYADGTTASTIRFNAPQGVAVDAQGTVYVADRANNIIRKVTAAGAVSTLAGVTTPGFYDGLLNTTTGIYPQFNYPGAIALDAQGNVYVADLKNYAIREVTPTGTVSTVAGGLVYKTLVNAPAGIALDAQGNIFVADQSGRVIEITAAKVLYTLAGSINTAGYVDGDGAAARFSSPQGITLDAQGNLYVADSGNNVIRKIVLKVTQ